MKIISIFAFTISLCIGTYCMLDKDIIHEIYFDSLAIVFYCMYNRLSSKEESD